MSNNETDVLVVIPGQTWKLVGDQMLQVIAGNLTVEGFPSHGKGLIAALSDAANQQTLAAKYPDHAASVLNAVDGMKALIAASESRAFSPIPRIQELRHTAG